MRNLLSKIYDLWTVNFKSCIRSIYVGNVHKFHQNHVNNNYNKVQDVTVNIPLTVATLYTT